MRNACGTVAAFESNYLRRFAGRLAGTLLPLQAVAKTNFYFSNTSA
jgi:hypothetical protein